MHTLTARPVLSPPPLWSQLLCCDGRLLQLTTLFAEMRPREVTQALTAVDSNNNTALTFACAAGKQDVVKLLLSLGAVFTAGCDKDGNNILHKVRG